MDDHALATEAARRAGDFLVELRARGGTGAEGDRQADDLILPFLREHRPGRRDPLRGVEGRPRAASTRERVWIVDPLDGTREYGEAGRTDWAVHVALVVDQTPVAAAVALPAQGLVLSTEPTPTLAPATDGPIRILVSRTRPPELATRLAELLDAELVPMGSAGAKATAVLLGLGDVYAHGGGQYEWDSAAPVGVANAAGCHTLPPRRFAAALQPARPVPARPARLSPRARRPGPRRHHPRHRLKRRGPRRPAWLRTEGRSRRPATVSRLHTGCGAAWLARSVRDAEAPGSNPGTPITNVLVSAPVDQDGITSAPLRNAIALHSRRQQYLAVVHDPHPLVVGARREPAHPRFGPEHHRRGRVRVRDRKVGADDSHRRETATGSRCEGRRRDPRARTGPTSRRRRPRRRGRPQPDPAPTDAGCRPANRRRLFRATVRDDVAARVHEEARRARGARAISPARATAHPLTRPDGSSGAEPGPGRDASVAPNVMSNAPLLSRRICSHSSSTSRTSRTRVLRPQLAPPDPHDLGVRAPGAEQVVDVLEPREHASTSAASTRSRTSTRDRPFPTAPRSGAGPARDVADSAHAAWSSALCRDCA